MHLHSTAGTCVGGGGMPTVPVCLSAVFGAVVVVVALIGQTVWVSTLMQCCHLLK